MAQTATDKMAPGTTDSLVAWAHGLAIDDVPDAVRTHATLLALDGIGAGLYGGETPWGRMVVDTALETGGIHEAAVWGSGRSAPAGEACLANATLMHSFEVDDLHAAAVLHGGAQVVPPALAIAGLRATGLRAGLPRGLPSDGDLLLAMTAGLEVGARIGMLTGAAQLGRGFHPSPNTGLFSAATTAGLLLDLTRDQLGNALGIAASSGGFLMAAQYGAMVKRLHPGRAAQAGVQAALLAARGFTGIAEVLEEPYGGFAKAYAGLDDPDEISTVLADLGDRWETLRFSPKAYPCCGSNHTAIDASLALLDREPALDVDDVARIEVECSTRTAEHVGWPYSPASVTTAQMNLPYAVAVTLLDGEMTVDQFAESRLDDPRVVSLAQRVQPRPADDIDATGREGRHALRLTVVMRDGATHHQQRQHARGSAHDPLSTDDVKAKFHQLAAALPESDAKVLEQSVMDLATCSDESHATASILDGLAQARS